MMNEQPQKILVQGPAWVGDMVMAQTLFKVLKQQNPTVMIDVLAPPWSKALLERMPEVHQSYMSPFGHGQLSLLQRRKLAKQLAVAEYDQIIVLQNSLKSAWLPFWTGIQQRTGWQGEWPRHLFLNDVRKLEEDKLPLMIQRFAALGLPKSAALTQDLPRPRLAVASESVSESLKKYGLTPPTVPLLVLAPGAEFGPSKRWPPNYYADVANAKLAQGWQVWMFGSSKDEPVALEIQKRVQDRVVNFVGKTNLAEAVDLMSLATIVVSNDSGLMHIAAALDRPLVAIYGSTSPRFTPPLADKVQVLDINLPCSPCFQRMCPLGHWRCMLDLKPELVLQSIDNLLA